jgi:hypothetical protein
VVDQQWSIKTGHGVVVGIDITDQFVASAGHDAKVRLWKAENGNYAAVFNVTIYSL